MSYEMIKTEVSGEVGIITLNRPKALNALNTQTMNEVIAAAKAFDEDAKVGCIILTGSEKAFAAGAGVGSQSEVAKGLSTSRRTGGNRPSPVKTGGDVGSKDKSVRVVADGTMNAGGGGLGPMADSNGDGKKLPTHK